jgi:hypothetical protein
MYMMMVTEKVVGICQKKKKMGAKEEDKVEEEKKGKKQYAEFGCSMKMLSRPFWFVALSLLLPSRTRP